MAIVRLQVKKTAHFLVKYHLMLTFMLLNIAWIGNAAGAATYADGIQLYQKNLHLSEEHKQRLANDIVRYRNADNLWDVLRDEFTFRCVYCLSRETWYPNGSSSFSVDHMEPQISRPDLLTVYTNLVYACNRCNSLKSDLALLPIDPRRN